MFLCHSDVIATPHPCLCNLNCHLSWIMRTFAAFKIQGAEQKCLENPTSACQCFCKTHCNTCDWKCFLSCSLCSNKRTTDCYGKERQSALNTLDGHFLSQKFQFRKEQISFTTLKAYASRSLLLCTTFPAWLTSILESISKTALRLIYSEKALVQNWSWNVSPPNPTVILSQYTFTVVILI